MAPVGRRSARSCGPPSVRPAPGVAARLAEASKKCKLYLITPAQARGRASPPAGCAVPAIGGSEDGRASLYGDGLVRIRLDGSASDGVPPGPHSHPARATRADSCDRPARAPAARPAKKAAKPARKAAKPAAKKAAKKTAKKSAKKAAKKAAKKTAKKAARKAAKKSAEEGRPAPGEEGRPKGREEVARRRRPGSRRAKRRQEGQAQGQARPALAGAPGVLAGRVGARQGRGAVDQRDVGEAPAESCRGTRRWRDRSPRSTARHGWRAAASGGRPARRARARRSCASAWASQKVQIENAPSSPSSPSGCGSGTPARRRRW